ncbi:MAG TPA: Hpt domain-containing protein [Candidatus Limnocylindria bacterium]|nr:Hpt domain-containing protein [Candidatus Limnocylindria bacterium]
MQPPDAPVLDEAVLADLLESTGDDPAFVRELLETYLGETPTQLAAMAAAVEAADAEALVRPSHTLKSSSATLGAARLSALGRELEMTGRSGALPAAVSQTLEAAQAAWAATESAMHAWLAEHGG